jgi:hypothetical protein
MSVFGLHTRRSQHRRRSSGFAAPSFILLALIASSVDVGYPGVLVESGHGSNHVRDWPSSTVAFLFHMCALRCGLMGAPP